MRRGWLEAYLRRRFAWLLALLLLTIGIDPVLEGVGFAARALVWMLAFALFAAAVGKSARGHHSARGLELVFTVSLGGWLVLTLGGTDTGSPLEPALLGVSSLTMAALLLAVVLGRGGVDGERIYAALCVYLLMSITFGGIFAALEALSPGSLSAGGDDIGSAICFSFVTLATLGYGDILPAGHRKNKLRSGVTSGYERSVKPCGDPRGGHCTHPSSAHIEQPSVVKWCGGVTPRVCV